MCYTAGAGNAGYPGDQGVRTHSSDLNSICARASGLGARAFPSLATFREADFSVRIPSVHVIISPDSSEVTAVNPDDQRDGNTVLSPHIDFSKMNEYHSAVDSVRGPFYFLLSLLVVACATAGNTSGRPQRACTTQVVISVGR